jgi:hypothetical protein
LLADAEHVLVRRLRTEIGPARRFLPLALPAIA